MFDYFTSSLITASLWGYIIIIDVLIGKLSPLLAICCANILYGITGLLILCLFYDKIKVDFNSAFKNNRTLLIVFAMSIFFLGTCARYFYYNAYNKAGKKSHIAFTIMLALPIVFSGLGAYFFLKEKINLPVFFGMSLVVIGIIIMKYFEPKN